MEPYFVSRQSNYYDDGAYSVEIARRLDFAGPGMLADRYPGDGTEYDDPREAAETAIELARSWRADVGRKRDGGLPFRCFTIAGNAIVYPMLADAFTAPELRVWARVAWERLPKCDRCGEVGRDWEIGPSPDDRFCSESCADRAAEDYLRENAILCRDCGTSAECCDDCYPEAGYCCECGPNHRDDPAMVEIGQGARL